MLDFIGNIFDSISQYSPPGFTDGVDVINSCLPEGVGYAIVGLVGFVIVCKFASIIL